MPVFNDQAARRELLAAALPGPSYGRMPRCRGIQYVRRGPQYTDNDGFVSIPVTVRELAERLRADEFVQLLAAASSAGPPRAAR